MSRYGATIHDYGIDIIKNIPWQWRQDDPRRNAAYTDARDAFATADDLLNAA